MAATLETPTDEITGLPHTILLYDDPSWGDDVWWDYHHHFFPRRDPELFPASFRPNDHPDPESLNLEDLASLAVRMSRGQLLPRPLHNLAHRRLTGPRLPRTLDEKFQTTVRACSGIVSRFAIDLRRPDDKLLAYMDDDTFARVADRRLLCTERAYYHRAANYRRRVFGGFVVRYSINQNIRAHVSDLVVEEFLETGDDARKRELGNFILTEALDAQIRAAQPTHQQMVGRGLVQPGRPGIGASLKKLVHKDRLAAYFPVLTDQLQTAA